MALPAPLLTALEECVAHHPKGAVKAAAERLSARYRAVHQGASVALADEAEVLAYCLTRMPATFAATQRALELTAELAIGFQPKTHLDIGCGTGAALYAAQTVFGSLQQRGEDRHASMLHMADVLAKASQSSIQFHRATFEEGDSQSHDLVTAAYAFGEAKESQWPKLADRLWQRAGGVIVVVEPGSSRGYQTILALRDRFLAIGGAIIAPCPHHQACPMQEAWCHNGIRLERSRLHKHFKNADAPFEDEPFCYLAIAKPGISFTRPLGRIVHKPIDNKTGLTFPACLADGHMADVVVPRRDTHHHRAARRLGRGNALFAFED